MCYIVKKLLYLALFFNLVFHSALPMCCIAKKNLILGACVELHLSFRAADELHCKKLLYLALVLNYVFNCQCGCVAL